MTITFDNPDVQIHNLVIVKPGAVENIGLLADQMAQDPDAMTRHFVPESDLVIWSTPHKRRQRKHRFQRCCRWDHAAFGN